MPTKQVVQHRDVGAIHAAPDTAVEVYQAWRVRDGRG